MGSRTKATAWCTKPVSWVRQGMGCGMRYAGDFFSNSSNSSSTLAPAGPALTSSGLFHLGICQGH